MSNNDVSFNLLGTLLPAYEDDESVQKPVHIQDQTVKDERGRRRFHGAFTGGFSAGYYNTVGSEQGWEPSSFKSSRDKKTTADASQMPEMYMDAEDFNDYGIAPKTVGVNVDFSANKNSIKRPNDDKSSDNSTANIVNIKCPIGEHLMFKLGWKRGHGLGELTTAERIEETTEKVYGCSRYAPQNKSTCEGIKFTSPRDICPIDFTAKENKHGIGYQGINYETAMITGGKKVVERFSLFDDPMMLNVKPTNTNKGMSGQAFGTGAFENEDSDIYETLDISKYNRTIGGIEERSKSSASKNGGQIERIVDMLDGFTIAKDTDKVKLIYPAPILPSGFIPIHSSGSNTDAKKIDSGTKMDSNVRGLIMGEKPRVQNKGVFEVLNKDGKRTRKSRFTDNTDAPSKFTSVKPASKADDSSKRIFTDKPAVDVTPRKFTVSKTTTKVPAKLSYDLPTPPPVTSKPLFQPFSNNQPKQIRYDYYLFLNSIKKTDLYSDYISTLTIALSEWELQQEIKEFARAISIYKPLTGTMASRFTKAGFVDNSVIPKKPEEKKEVKPVTYGKLTRTITKWFPESLLCKRFNIANPHSDQKNQNAEEAKSKEKFSVFKFLDSTKIETVQLPLEKPNIVNIPSASEEIPESNVIFKDVSKENNDIKMVQDSEERPTMDMFKAIFENSDDDSNESSDEEADIEPIIPITIDNPIAKDSEKVVIINKMIDIIEDNNLNTSFGPALPPIGSTIQYKKAKKNKSKKSKKKKKKNKK